MWYILVTLQAHITHQGCHDNVLLSLLETEERRLCPEIAKVRQSEDALSQVLENLELLYVIC
jgi:hypothetical protein